MELVYLDGKKEPYTTSEIIAECAGVQHHTITRTIRKNLSRFERYGKVRFKIQAMASGQQSKDYILNERINVTLNDSHEPVVYGRQLHEALGVKTAYKDWFPRMVEYGFTKNEDFCSNLSESTGGRRAIDHIIKLDMAKEIAMIQRTEKGKEVRAYFIQIEKDYNSPEKVMAIALINLNMEYQVIKTMIFRPKENAH